MYIQLIFFNHFPTGLFRVIFLKRTTVFNGDWYKAPHSIANEQKNQKLNCIIRQIYQRITVLGTLKRTSKFFYTEQNKKIVHPLSFEYRTNKNQSHYYSDNGISQL